MAGTRDKACNNWSQDPFDVQGVTAQFVRACSGLDMGLSAVKKCCQKLGAGERAVRVALALYTEELVL